MPRRVRATLGLAALAAGLGACECKEPENILPPSLEGTWSRAEVRTTVYNPATREVLTTAVARADGQELRLHPCTFAIGQGADVWLTGTYEYTNDVLWLHATGGGWTSRDTVVRLTDSELITRRTGTGADAPGTRVLTDLVYRRGAED